VKNGNGFGSVSCGQESCNDINGTCAALSKTLIYILHLKPGPVMT
jgi:hypothetical protein